MDTNMKILVCGAGGFIGSHLVKKLVSQGHKVHGVDLKHPEWSKSSAEFFFLGDLREQWFCKDIFQTDYDEVYQLAADMGGAGYIFTGENDRDIMTNALINLNVCKYYQGKIFYSSSACVYSDLDTREENAKPDSPYGYEKLFSEKLYESRGNCRIARFHNIFGPEGVYKGGREKAPAAICRKIIEADKEIEIWGDGKQVRSFLYIDECLEGVERLMKSGCQKPINIGSSEMININQLAEMVMGIADKKLSIKHIDGPLGVRGRTSDNKLIKEILGWEPSDNLQKGLLKTYQWIKKQ